MQVAPRWSVPGTAWSRRLLGHNTVWCRGGLGVWNDATASVRDDVAEAVRALDPGVLRFPGGTRSMRWRFDETIGPRSERRAQCDPFLGVLDATTYGLAEGIDFIASMGAEVSLVAPWVDGSPQATAAMVAYVCGDPSCALQLGVDDHGRDWGRAGDWAARRIAHGREAPWKVALLEIGNEPYLGLPIGPERSCGRDGPFRQCERFVNGRPVPTTAERYAAALRETASLVRVIAPNLLIGAAAAGGLFEHEDARSERGAADLEADRDDPWNPRILRDASDAFDLWVAHPYVVEPTEARSRLGERTRTLLKQLRALDQRPVALTEHGFMFGGDTLRNALASVDVVRVAAEENVAFAMRHLLIEDDPGGPFATSALLLGPDRRPTPAWYATRSMAQTLRGQRVPCDGALATRDGDTLGVVLTSLTGDAVNIALPPGRWNAEVHTLWNGDLDATEATHDHAQGVFEGALRLTPQGSCVVSATLRPSA